MSRAAHLPKNGRPIPVLGYPSKMAAVKGMKHDGLTETQIAKLLDCKPKAVHSMINRLRSIDPEFKKEFPGKGSGAWCSPFAAPDAPRGYTQEYVDAIRDELAGMGDKDPRRLELELVLCFARDPKTAGVRG